MSEALKTIASLSVSGALLILLLFLCKPLLKDRFSKRWQYYIWLAAVARLLLPFSPEAAPMERLFQEPQPAMQASAPYTPTPVETPEGDTNYTEVPFSPFESVSPQTPAPVPAAANAGTSGIDISLVLTLVWLGGALSLLVRKVTVYQSFARCIRAGCREVSDPVLLDRMAQAGEQAGVRRPVELWENPLAASPMLLGVFRPRIVLPTADLTEVDFRYTVIHELTHYRRGDLIYKWLVQLAVCLHWFNPLVWLMAREIDGACELACDEAVLETLETAERRAYGATLLRALETGGAYASIPGSANLGKNAELLKERLRAIMNFKKPSRLTAALSLVLAAALVTGAAAAGAYTGPGRRTSPVIHVSGTAPSISDLIQGNQADNRRLRAALAAEACYEEDNIVSFSVSYPLVSKEEQVSWLERSYADKRVSFFNVCLFWLEEDDPALVETYAERAYTDRRISFFSAAVQYMDDGALESWIVRASADREAAFLSILLGKAGRDDELDALEAELAAKQLAEYEEHGVTRDGKNYYYQGQLVRIFLDARPDSSFYTLDTNPSGKVDIKIVRNMAGQIQSVAYMTKEEVQELFGDWDEPEETMDTMEIQGKTYYLVFNEAQLRAIGSGPYGLGQNYLQQADIQLSSDEWVPIGTAERPFTGSYNGNGYEIKGLTITDPETKLAGLFGVGSGAKVYNVTLRDYDVTCTGQQTSQKAVDPVLALGLNGSKCYDNFLYPKERNRGTFIHIPVDYDRIRDGAYCWLGEYTLSAGDCIQYDVSAETGNGLAVGFADMEHRPDEVAYCTVSNHRTNGILQCAATFSLNGQSAAVGQLRLFLHATDGELGNVKGSITLELKDEKQNPDDHALIPLGTATLQATTDGIFTPHMDELPDEVQNAIGQCANHAWYVIHHGNRQYLWYGGFPELCIFFPLWEDGTWRVQFQTTGYPDDSDILISFPDNAPLEITLDGKVVQLTEIIKNRQETPRKGRFLFAEKVFSRMGPQMKSPGLLT